MGECNLYVKIFTVDSEHEAETAAIKDKVNSARNTFLAQFRTVYDLYRAESLEKMDEYWDRVQDSPWHRLEAGSMFDEYWKIVQGRVDKLRMDVDKKMIGVYIALMRPASRDDAKKNIEDVEEMG